MRSASPLHIGTHERGEKPYFSHFFSTPYNGIAFFFILIYLTQNIIIFNSKLWHTMAEVHSKLLCKHFSYNIVPPLAWLLVAACSPACLPYLPACQHAPVVVPLKISASFAIQLIYIFFCSPYFSFCCLCRFLLFCRHCFQYSVFAYIILVHTYIFQLLALLVVVGCYSVLYYILYVRQSSYFILSRTYTHSYSRTVKTLCRCVL